VVVSARCDHNTPHLLVSYVIHYSCSHNPLIQLYDAAGKVIETHEPQAEFKEW
jgi:hypothetical protein